MNWKVHEPEHELNSHICRLDCNDTHHFRYIFVINLNFAEINSKFGAIWQCFPSKIP